MFKWQIIKNNFKKYKIKLFFPYNQQIINFIKSWDWNETHRSFNPNDKSWELDLESYEKVFSLLSTYDSDNLLQFKNYISTFLNDLNKISIVVNSKNTTINNLDVILKKVDKEEIRRKFGIQLSPQKVHYIKKYNPKYQDWDGIILANIQYDFQNNQLIIGKAYTQSFIDFLRQYGFALDNIKEDFQLKYINDGAITWNNEITLRPYQNEVINLIQENIKNKYGMSFQLPTGTGKTIVILNLIYRLKLKTLILVDTKDLLYQWHNEIKRCLNYDAGIVGDGQFILKDITVATVQSIWNYLKQCGYNNNDNGYNGLLDELIENEGIDEDDEAPITNEFFSNFSLIDLDEMHIGAANTYLKVLKSFSTAYYIGQSATTWRTDRMEKLLWGILGTVDYKLERKTAEENGYLTKTIIKIIDGINLSDYDDDTNFQTIRKSVITDEYRNKLISDISITLPKPCLILTEQVNHLNNIKTAFEKYHPEIKIATLTGKDKSEKREEIKSKFLNGNIDVLITTIFKKGTDIPSIKSLILSFPMKSDVAIIQMIGRALRLHNGKNEAIIVDIRDTGNKYVNDWFNERISTYKKEKWIN